MKKLSISNRLSQKMPSKEIPRGKMHVIKRSKSQVHHDEHAIIYISANVSLVMTYQGYVMMCVTLY